MATKKSSGNGTTRKGYRKLRKKYGSGPGSNYQQSYRKVKKAAKKKKG